MNASRMVRDGAVSGAVLVCLFGSTLQAQAPAPVTAIRDAAIVPVTGPRIPRGTVLLRGDKIEAVGAEVAVPPGATIIDGTGLTVYPGLIDSGTQLGLSEIGSVPGSIDTQELGDFNPHDDALTAVNPHSELIPVTRANGITTAITAAQGGLISGSAALIDLAGWTPYEMARRPRAGMVVTYPRAGGGRGQFGFGRGGGGGADAAERQSRQVRALYQYFVDAKAYAAQRAALDAASQAPDRIDLPLEAMLPALRGEIPVVVNADDVQQIRGAIALADSFGLKLVIRGGSEAWQVRETLAQKKIPVIVGPTVRAPGDDDPYDMIYANAGALAKAGVLIAFQTDDVADSRNLPYNAALAEAYGLDPDEALKAVTINPATIWGVADQIGSIEPGKVANLIVTTGDPLDVRSVVRYLFIRGESIPLTDRHTKLYEEFRGRPKP